ncbi:MAG: cyanophycinase [Sumerlaeia bacterium]
MKLRSLTLFLAVLMMAAAPAVSLAQRPAKPSGLVSYITGNANDSSRGPSNGPVICLQGGNFDIDEAFENRVWPVLNGGDVVVLRTDNSSGYQSYLYNITGSNNRRPDSVETIVVNSRTKANSSYVDWVLRTAEFIYIAGGDQAEYLNYWKDTKVESAIRAAYNRGAAIGGISAGCAVMGEFIYDPDGVPGVTTSEAVSNPYRSSMIISNGFVAPGLTNDIITDTHFYERDRMGRSMAFMARLRQDGRTAKITAVCVDEDTAMTIDRNRVGRVDGDGYVYVLREDGATYRRQVRSGQPLRYEDVLCHDVPAGGSFNFGNNTSSRAAYRVDVDGRYPSAPYTPSNPY